MTQQITLGILVSIPIWLGALMFLRRSGMDWITCWLVSTVFFPSPIWMAKNGAASYLYLVDIVGVWIIILAAKLLHYVPTRQRLCIFLLLMGVAVLPAISALFFDETRLRISYSLSAYRAFIAGGIYVLIVARRGFLIASRIYGAFLWFFCSLVVVTVLQYNGLIDINAYKYDRLLEPQFTSAEAVSYVVRDTVFNFFRASFGIMATTAVAIACGLVSASGRIAQSIGFTVCALTLVLLAGSKTGFGAMAFVFVAGFLTKQWRFTVVAILCVCLGGGALAFVGRVDSLTDGIPFVRELSDTDELFGKVVTLSSRIDIWHNFVSIVELQPSVLFGLPLKDGSLAQLGREFAQIGTAHCEYLEILIRGGFLGLICYLSGILIVGVRLYLARNQSTEATVGFLALVGGLFQAFTVGHLQPALLLHFNVMMSALLYGLAMRVPLVSL